MSNAKLHNDTVNWRGYTILCNKWVSQTKKKMKHTDTNTYISHDFNGSGRLLFGDYDNGYEVAIGTKAEKKTSTTSNNTTHTQRQYQLFEINIYAIT